MVSSTDKEGKGDYVPQEEHEEYEPEGDLDLDGMDGLEEDDIDQDYAQIAKKSKPRKLKTEKDAQPDSDPDEKLDETVFIDNLPKEETAIRVMLKDVNKNIRILEKNFFEEEDSEEEEKFINKLKDLTVQA
jgi:hypothetical protein